MKRNIKSILALISILSLPVGVCAQQDTTAAEKAEYLRLQVIQVQSSEELLRLRAQQLDEELKPENIERALAGIGSTKPEELRDHRRRLLTLERDGVRAQLKISEMSRLRLEAAIAAAEGRAYQESALPMPSPPTQMLAGNSFTLVQALRMVPLVSVLLVLAVIIGLTFRRSQAFAKAAVTTPYERKVPDVL